MMKLFSQMVGSLLMLCLMTIVLSSLVSQAAVSLEVQAPEISVAPNKISKSLVVNQQLTQTFTISNRGNEVLTWAIAEDTTPSQRKERDLGSHNKERAVMSEGMTSRAFIPKGHALSATPCVDGMAGEFPCQNVDLMAFLPLLEMGAANNDGGTDIWGWTDSQDGKEYALMALKSGTSFVDISDPANPIYLGKLAGHNDSISGWRDIKVYNDHAFIVSEATNHGIQVFDLTQLRSVISPPMSFTETAHYNGFGRRHNIVINEESGFAYGAGSLTDQKCGAGLHVVNIQNPTKPTFAGCFSETGYIHDAQCVIYNGPDSLYQGREICFNANADALTIADLTDKTGSILLVSKEYVGHGYTHQGWLTDDHAYFLLGDEYDELNDGYNTSTYIWDVSDLDEPALIGIYRAETAAIDHNLYTRGDYVYQSNYSAGLRILESSEIANGKLSEVAYFDIYPANDAPNFNGSWSNYPYFDSGVIIISGRGEGLFIVRPTLPADFTVQASRHQLNVCENESASLDIDLGAIHGYQGSVMLSMQDLPPGITADFKPKTLSVPAQSRLTLNLSGSPTGSPPKEACCSPRLTISGSDGELSHQDKLTLHISATAPISPTLNQPPNNATDLSLIPTFTWSAVPNAQSYQLEVATDATFSDIIYSATTVSPTHSTNQSVNANSSYYWRVSAQNSCGQHSSTSFYFTTDDSPACESLSEIPWVSTSPISGTTLANTTSPLNIILDSTELAFGSHHATLCIESNDPLTPKMSVPLSLTVTDQIEIFLPLLSR